MKNLLNEKKKNSTYQCCKYGDSTPNSHRTVSACIACCLVVTVQLYGLIARNAFVGYS